MEGDRGQRWRYTVAKGWKSWNCVVVKYSGKGSETGGSFRNMEAVAD